MNTKRYYQDFLFAQEIRINSNCFIIRQFLFAEKILWI